MSEIIQQNYTSLNSRLIEIFSLLRLQWMEPIFAAPLYYELRTAHGGLEHTDCLVRRGEDILGQDGEVGRGR